MIDRRAFMSVALAASFPGWAQSPARHARVTIIGPRIRDFERRLEELGFVQGRNLTLEYPAWDTTAADVRRVVSEVVRKPVDVIVAQGSLPIRVAIDATRTIPIVMVYAGDPIGMKFVKSMARPGGNVTGVAWDPGVSIASKTVEVLKDALPRARTFGVLWYGEDPAHQFYSGEARRAFAPLGLRCIDLPITAPAELPAAFQRAAQEHVGGILMLPDHFMGKQWNAALALATAHRIPLMFAQGGLTPDDGMLLTYGPDVRDHPRRAADYVARILKGARPGDIAIEQTDRFDLRFNLRTAAALGVQIPDAVLARADEVVR